MKRVDTNRVLELPEGDTEETCKEHLKAMSKELSKNTNRNLAMVRELMMITYAIRRKRILLEENAIVYVLAEYPALGLMSEVSPYNIIFCASWVLI